MVWYAIFLIYILILNIWANGIWRSLKCLQMKVLYVAEVICYAVPIIKRSWPRFFTMNLVRSNDSMTSKNHKWIRVSWIDIFFKLQTKFLNSTSIAHELTILIVIMSKNTSGLEQPGLVIFQNSNLASKVLQLTCQKNFFYWPPILKICWSGRL